MLQVHTSSLTTHAPGRVNSDAPLVPVVFRNFTSVLSVGVVDCFHCLLSTASRKSSATAEHQARENIYPLSLWAAGSLNLNSIKTLTPLWQSLVKRFHVAWRNGIINYVPCMYIHLSCISRGIYHSCLPLFHVFCILVFDKLWFYLFKT